MQTSFLHALIGKQTASIFQYNMLNHFLQGHYLNFNENIFLLLCRLKASYDTITMLERGKDSITKFQQETTR